MDRYFLVHCWRWWLQPLLRGTLPPPLIQGFPLLLFVDFIVYCIFGFPQEPWPSSVPVWPGHWKVTNQRSVIISSMISPPNWWQDSELPSILLEPDRSQRGGESWLAAGVRLPRLLRSDLLILSYLLLAAITRIGEYGVEQCCRADRFHGAGRNAAWEIPAGGFIYHCIIISRDGMRSRNCVSCILGVG